MSPFFNCSAADFDALNSRAERSGVCAVNGVGTVTIRNVLKEERNLLAAARTVNRLVRVFDIRAAMEVSARSRLRVLRSSHGAQPEIRGVQVESD